MNKSNEQLIIICFNIFISFSLINLFVDLFLDCFTLGQCCGLGIKNLSTSLQRKNKFVKDIKRITQVVVLLLLF